MELIVVFLGIMWTMTPTGVGSFVPISPCPDIFSYRQLKMADVWVGLVFIPPPPQFPIPLKVEVFLYIETVLPSKYAGILELNEPRHDVLSRFVNSIWSPVQYIVRFPLPSPLPTVKNISVNDNLLCIGPPVFGPVITTIHLKNTLNSRTYQLHKIRNIVDSAAVTENLKTLSVEKEESEVKLEDVCGQPALINPLIAGGRSTLRGEWPWLVALYVSRPLGLVFHCSATLISNQVVVTAAHCLNHERTGVISVDSVLLYLGKFNLQNWTEPTSVLRQALQIFIHPEYNKLNFSNDLAVVKFQPVSFTAFIRPACLWSGQSDLDFYVGMKGTVAGWGRNNSFTPLSKEPQVIDLEIVSQEKCLRSRPTFVLFTTEKTFCAGNRNGTGPCNGDSGAGLFLMREDTCKWELRGIVSLSLLSDVTLSCNLNEYTVFTDTAKYRQWLTTFVT